MSFKNKVLNDWAPYLCAIYDDQLGTYKYREKYSLTSSCVL